MTMKSQTQHMNFEKPILIDLPMPIETDRLRLCIPRAGNGADIYPAKVETWDMLNKWMPWATDEPNLEDDEMVARQLQIDFLSRKDLTMFVFEKDTGQFVGGTGLHRFDWKTRLIEIGYWYRKSAQGKGYATESTKALIKYAFDVLQANKVIIAHACANEASKRVIQKCGFEHEYRVQKDYYTPRGEIFDHDFYCLWNADHLNDIPVKWEE